MLKFAYNNKSTEISFLMTSEDMISKGLKWRESWITIYELSSNFLQIYGGKSLLWTIKLLDLKSP